MNTEKIDSFLDRNSKKWMAGPEARFDVRCYVLFLNIMFLGLPFLLFSKQYFHTHVYSRRGYKSVDKVGGKVRSICKAADFDPGNREPVYVLLDNPAFIARGLIFFEDAVVYKLAPGKKIMDQSRDDCVGVIELEKFNDPTVSRKHMGAVNLKVDDEVIGAFLDVERPEYLQKAMTAIARHRD